MIPANFNQLYYFWVIAKAGSISSAAKRLLLNQSTLSLQMKQLEASFGKRLLTRSRHGVGLTGEGKLAFDYCERIYVHAEELVALLKDDRPSAAAVFRLGVSQTVSWKRAVEVIRLIKSSGRDISVRISTRSSEELQERLERHMLDLVLSDIDLSVRLGRDYKSRLAASTQLYFVAAPEVKARMKTFPSGLTRVPLLFRSPSNPVRKEAEHFLRRKGITPNIQAEVENPDLIRILAVQGEGAGLMDVADADMDLAQGRLVKLHRDPVGIRENVWFTCNRQAKTLPALQKAMDALMGRFSFKG